MLEESMELLVGGVGASRFLGRVYAVQAIAEMGLGREREALWDWKTAIYLFPDLRNLPVEAFGEAGERFLEIARCSPCWPRSCEPPQSSAEAPPADVTPPRKIMAPQPVFPRAQSLRAEAPLLIVQVIVDKQGLPLGPEILKGDGEPTFVVSALSAMREWRFEPARLADGTPVDVYYNLTINYVSPYEKRSKRASRKRDRDQKIPQIAECPPDLVAGPSVALASVAMTCNEVGSPPG